MNFDFVGKFVRVLLLAAITVCCFSTTAWAQTEAEKKQAQVYFEAGAEEYAKGEYSKAIVEFLKGYNLVPNAMFLYNISLSYRKLGNWEDALAAAEKAKTEEGMPDDVKVRNDSRINAYRTIIAAQDMADDAARLAQAEETKDPEPEVKKSEGSSFGALGWTGVILTVAGVGAGVGALIVANGVSSDIDDYEAAAQTGDRTTYDRLRDDIESGQSTGQILMYTGIGLGVAGLTMIMIEVFAGGESDSQAIYVAPTEKGATAGYFLRF